MIRKSLCVLFWSILSVAALTPGVAVASTPLPGPPSGPETLSPWYLRYSAEGGRDLFGAQRDASGVEKDGARNVEFASRGEAWGDDRYRREFRIGPGRPYLRSLVGTEMLGVFLKSLGAAYSKRGREEDALRIYDDAVRFFPGLPEAHFNAGVSLHRRGRFDEAAARYRGALDLDPDLAPARDNLGIVLAIRGKFAEAISEGRRAVELEPRNAAMRRNLASTFHASGNIEEGIRQFRAAKEFDIAQTLRVRIEPSMLKELERGRLPSHPGS